jgi:predicted HTH domain antitoxin
LAVFIVRVGMQTTQVTMPLPFSVTEADAKLLLAVKLFETGKLSLGQAAELSGYSYRSFLEVLRQNKIPVANYSALELEKELEA